MPLSVSHSLVRSPEVGAIGSRMQGCMAAALWAQQHERFFIGYFWTGQEDSPFDRAILLQ